MESIADIHFGNSAVSPSVGRPRHCSTARSNNNPPRMSLTTPTTDELLAESCSGSINDNSVKDTTATVIPITHPAKNPKLVLRAWGDSSINTAAMMASGPIAMPTLRGRISPMTERIPSNLDLHAVGRPAVPSGDVAPEEVLA
jgi:hypothetical protein